MSTSSSSISSSSSSESDSDSDVDLPSTADVDKELFMTVDNEMELYIDGVANPINKDPSAKDWMVTKRVIVPAGSRVIAVKATDKGLWAGLLASTTDDSLLSDGTWKVSTVASDGWTNPEFDDSNWEQATELGQHGMDPWKARDQISSKAKWIWSKKSYYEDMGDHVVYFRYHTHQDQKDVDNELLMTVDNEMELYIDGIPNQINNDPSAKDWTVTKRVVMPVGSRIIAVKATDKGLWAGLLASTTDDSLLSDGTWKVSTVASDGWTNPEFDDSSWEQATELGQHGMEPWKARDQISSKARWIWSKKSHCEDTGVHVVYFRYQIDAYKELLMTVDNEMELYIDGIPNSINNDPSAKDWTVTKRVIVPARSRVIAVKATDKGLWAGLLASTTDNSLLSDGTWKVSTVASDGWTNPEFDDSSWQQATELGQHGMEPWKERDLISFNAKWIWAKKSYYEDMGVHVVYFRYQIGSIGHGSCSGSRGLTQTKTKTESGSVDGEVKQQSALSGDATGERSLSSIVNSVIERNTNNDVATSTSGSRSDGVTITDSETVLTSSTVVHKTVRTSETVSGSHAVTVMTTQSGASHTRVEQTEMSAKIECSSSSTTVIGATTELRQTTTSKSLTAQLEHLAVDKELFMTVDNEMELYIDGVPNTINNDPSAKNWMVTKRVIVPAGSRVIAVKATDKGLWAGLLASTTDDSLLSDGTWKVSTVASDGWTNPQFDDSNWEQATELGQHGMDPWKTRDQISSKAKWIWGKKSYYEDMGDHVVYFRYHVG